MKKAPKNRLKLPMLKSFNAKKRASITKRLSETIKIDWNPYILQVNPDFIVNITPYVDVDFSGFKLKTTLGEIFYIESELK